MSETTDRARPDRLQPGDEWTPERHAEVRARCEHERRVRQYVTPIVGDIEAALDEIERLRELLADVAHSGVEYDDPRVGYVVVQVPRTVWDEVRALAQEAGR